MEDDFLGSFDSVYAENYKEFIEKIEQILHPIFHIKDKQRDDRAWFVSNDFRFKDSRTLGVRVIFRPLQKRDIGYTSTTVAALFYQGTNYMFQGHESHQPRFNEDVETEFSSFEDIKMSLIPWIEQLVLPTEDFDKSFCPIERLKARLPEYIEEKRKELESRLAAN